VCVLNNKKKLEGIKSFKVLKLKVVKSKISPKKKKKHQKVNNKYVVDLDVSNVNWNLESKKWFNVPVEDSLKSFQLIPVRGVVFKYFGKLVKVW
jgi:hypothetical protein